MKKLLRPLALLLVLVLMLSMTVIAAEGDDPTVTVTDANTTADFNGNNEFKSLTATYKKGTANMTYVCWLLAMDAKGDIILPKEDNVDTVVLDIKDAVADENGLVTFPNVLPKTDSMVSCAIAISGMGGMSLTKVGEINVPYTVGDVNNDGTVDTKDLTRLARHLVGAAVEINEKAADANGDNAIDTKDLTRLARYLVGGATLG